ncbi:unnamed protein product [Rhizophagus irregularis]|nr:unnamed protein product [Rhizophagus irregularis]
MRQGSCVTDVYWLPIGVYYATTLPQIYEFQQTKRIRQNLRKNNNFHNKENIQTSSSISNNTQFILPSPKKSKLTEFTKYDFDEFDGLEPLEDELNIDQMKETCPFCDEILPDLMSDKMKLALDRINNKQGKIEESDLYQEVGHRKAATPMMLMSRFESLRPGYYGSKGAVLIANTLIGSPCS